MSTSTSTSQKGQRRRSRGDGGLYQRKDGLWIGAVDLGFNAEGKRIRRTVSAKTRTEARKRLQALQRELEQTPGTGASEHRYTVGAWLDYWVDSRIEGHRAPKTVQDYRATLRNYLKPYLGDIPLRKLRPVDIADMLEDLEKRGLAASMTRKAYQTLQTALKFALVKDEIDANPVERVARPENHSEHHPEMSLADADKVFAAAETQRDRLMATLGLRMGLRIGEALALSWDDVHLDGDQPWVHVWRQAQYQDGTLQVLDGLKGSKPGKPKMRDLPLAPEHVAVFESVPVDERVGLVLGQGNRIWAPSGYRLRWKQLLASAGVSHIPPHGARSTAAIWLAAQGLGPRQVSDYLGHVHMQITSQFYHRQTLESLQLAFDKTFRA